MIPTLYEALLGLTALACIALIPLWVRWAARE